MAEFARVMPAWCHTRGQYAGEPLSWRHFAYGMAHIARAAAQEEHRLAVAARNGMQANGDEFTDYLNRLRTSAGMTR